jgi:hypothetical protein
VSAARILALALALGIARPAAADAPRPPPEAAEPFAPPAFAPRREVRGPARRAERWYGWQVITADMLGATLLLGGIAGEAEGAVAAGALGYLLVVPSIHFAHHEGGKAVASAFLFRPVIALVTLTIAEDQCDGCNEESGTFSGAVLAGWATASLLDAALAYETVWVTPIVTPEGGRGLALSGTF